MNAVFWREYRECFNSIAQDKYCRAVVVSAAGRFFSVGLDIKDPDVLPSADDKDVARKFMYMRDHVAIMQDTFTAMERCPQPVIIAVQGAAIGGAIDLLCAADIRLCTEKAFFCIKEVVS